MAKVTITNLTEEQATLLADWFIGQGEQDCEVWFDVNDCDSPVTESSKTQQNGNVIVTCRKPEW
jgi:hypothetical protein